MPSRNWGLKPEIMKIWYRTIDQEREGFKEHDLYHSTTSNTVKKDFAYCI